MKPLVISFSGGRTSAYMTYQLLKKYSGLREIVVVFANTGKERKETLDFVNACDVYFNFNTVWLEADGAGGYKTVTYETASQTGEPFELIIQKYGIPNPSFPHCTRELKTRPITKFAKSLFSEYDMAIGIRIDEPKRLVPKNSIVYPLAHDFPSTKEIVNSWWAAQPFNLQLRTYEGNCDLCWKKSKRKLLTLLVEQPHLADWWNAIEVKYGSFIPAGQIAGRDAVNTFYRQRESISDLIEESKFPFDLATDDFPLWRTSADLDHTDGCSESCEAF